MAACFFYITINEASSHSRFWNADDRAWTVEPTEATFYISKERAAWVAFNLDKSLNVETIVNTVDPSYTPTR